MWKLSRKISTPNMWSNLHIEKQLKINDNQGFPTMFASSDYMHYWWKNHLIVWHGPFQNKDNNKLIIFENVVSQSLLIWHVFFGLLDNSDDIIMLERSSLVTNLLQGQASNMSFVVNGNTYPKYYLLVDDIYPWWSIFVQALHELQGKKWQHFSKM